MKTKIISSLLAVVVVFLSQSSRAETLIDTSSCSWIFLALPPGIMNAQLYYASCPTMNLSLLLNKQVYYGNLGCKYYVTGPTASLYYITGDCNSFSLYLK